MYALNYNCMSFSRNLIPLAYCRGVAGRARLISFTDLRKCQIKPRVRLLKAVSCAGIQTVKINMKKIIAAETREGQIQVKSKTDFEKEVINTC
jgi:hypothetical protein